MSAEKCTRCGEILKAKSVKILELSQTDGMYYHNLPKGHISQGGFVFGTRCATIELQATTEKLKGVMNSENR